MNRDGVELEDLLRAALRAEAGGITATMLRNPDFAEDAAVAAGHRSTSTITRLDAAAAPVNGRFNHARWFAPLLAAAAAAAVAVGAIAIAHSHTARQHGPATHRPSPVPTLLKNGQQAATSRIPWDQVGPGWNVALWTPSTTIEIPMHGPVVRNRPESLFLVNPLGGRYLVTVLPAGKWQFEDWSDDGQRALIYRVPDVLPVSSYFAEVDLHTGRIGKEVRWATRAQTLTYTKPGGRAILVVDQHGVSRVELTGATQLVYPLLQPYDPIGLAIESPDGTELVGRDGGPTGHAMVLFDRNGRKIRDLAKPPGTLGCFPRRWWSSDTVLAACQRTGSDGEPWLLPVDGSAPTRLASGAGLELTEAAQLDSGLFVAASLYSGPPCTGSVGRYSPSGGYQKLPLTGHANNIALVGATRTTLTLADQPYCNGYSDLLSYNPATGQATTLLGGSMNSGSILSLRGYQQTDMVR